MRSTPRGLESTRWLAAVVGLLLGAAPAARIRPVFADDAPRAVPQRDGLIAELRASQARLQSLHLAYRYRSETLAPPDVVKRYLHVAYLIEETRAYAFRGNHRYFLLEGPPTASILEPDVHFDYTVLPNGAEVARRAAAKRAEAEARAAREGRPFENPTVVKRLHYSACSFDGQQFRRRFFDGAVAIENWSEWSDDQGVFPQEYLTNIGRTVADVFDASASRADQRLPDLLELRDFAVEPDPELIEDASCVSLRSPQGDRIWLDPACGYAVRRWDIFDPATGLLRERRTNRDFTEAAPGVWLPRVCWRDLCGKPLGPPEYHGVPMFRYVIEATQLSVNDVGDEVFRLEIVPGEQVIDSTILAADESGVRQPLTYVMPADPQAVEHAIAAALTERDEARATNRVQTVIVWINVAIAVLACLAIGFRRWRARHGPEQLP